jgi:hypothetical protein
VEGLCYDPETTSLLLACKDYPGKGFEKNKAVYSFALHTITLDEKPRFLIPLKDIRKNISGNMEQVGNRLYVYGNNPEELAMKCDAVKSEYRVVRRTNLEDVFLKLTGGREI